MTLCDKGGGGQNWPKKRYVIVERPLIGVPDLHVKRVLCEVKVVHIISLIVIFILIKINTLLY